MAHGAAAPAPDALMKDANGAAAANGAAHGAASPAAAAAAADLTAADYYADSYGHFGIHEEMLKDEVRTRGYRDAILRNAHLFRGRAVLDVGCGTGILSLFAARAGAAAVVGVDMSAIAEQAAKIVAANKLDHVVTIVRGKIEDVDLSKHLPPGVERFDIIISEWMGYFLLYESMLDSVLWARDRWLAPGGLLMPDGAALSLCAAEDGEYRAEKIDWWGDVWGFDMSCIGDVALGEPLVDCVNPAQVVTDTALLVKFDINTMRAADAAFAAPFRLVARRDDYLHALVASFDVAFGRTHRPQGFSTAPAARATHWKQTVFYLKEAITVYAGEALEGTLRCAPNARNPRDLDIEIEYALEGRAGSWAATQQYRMR